MIAAIVVLNAVLGFVQEAGAERAVLALRETHASDGRGDPDGRERELAAEEVVPGDLLVLREGDRVAADARVVGGGGARARRVGADRRVAAGGEGATAPVAATGRRSPNARRSCSPAPASRAGAGARS